MESRAFVENIARSFGGDFLLTLRIDGVARSELEGLRKSTPYRLKMSKWTEKRSLDANAYLWVLVTKIAEAVKSSKEEIYKELLARYGLVDEETTITVKPSVDMSRIGGHWMEIKRRDKWVGYIRIRGSSEYNKHEFCNFLDMVITEAKELGIETLPPDELERMKNEISFTEK